MIADERSEHRRRIALWLIIALLTLVLVVLAGHFLEPSPPKKIVLAAGQVGGGYYTFGADAADKIVPGLIDVEGVSMRVNRLRQIVAPASRRRP